MDTWREGHWLRVVLRAPSRLRDMNSKGGQSLGQWAFRGQLQGCKHRGHRQGHPGLARYQEGAGN